MIVLGSSFSMERHVASRSKKLSPAPRRDFAHRVEVDVLPTTANEVGEGMAAVRPGTAARTDLGLHPFRPVCGAERIRVGVGVIDSREMIGVEHLRVIDPIDRCGDRRVHRPHTGVDGIHQSCGRSQYPRGHTLRLRPGDRSPGGDEDRAEGKEQRTGVSIGGS